MLSILVCEDIARHREVLENIIETYMENTNCQNMELVLSSGNPYQVISYMEDKPTGDKLVFIDVNLNHDINGIELATKIRSLDTDAMIVFITTHGELAYLTFKYKIGAFDYIIKDQFNYVENKVIETLDAANARYNLNDALNRKFFPVKVGSELFNVPYDEIVFFVTHPSTQQKVSLFTNDGKFDFRGRIKDVATLDSQFFRCNQSYVVNITKVRRVDRLEKELEMDNGELVPIASRKIPRLVSAISEL